MGVAQEGGEPVARQQWKTLHMLDKCAKDHVRICDGLNRGNTIGGVLQKKSGDRVLCGGLGFQQVGQLHKLGGGRRTDASLSPTK